MNLPNLCPICASFKGGRCDLGIPGPVVDCSNHKPVEGETISSAEFVAKMKASVLSRLADMIEERVGDAAAADFREHAPLEVVLPIEALVEFNAIAMVEALGAVEELTARLEALEKRIEKQS